MKLYLTSGSTLVPRYANHTFHRVGREAQGRQGWEAVFFQKTTPLASQIPSLGAYETVVVTSELMNLFPKFFTLLSSRIKRTKGLRRIMFLGDVQKKNLDRAAAFSPHQTVSLAGYLLSSCAYLPHCGFRSPFNASPLVKCIVPSYHFVDKPKDRYLQSFYAFRIEISDALRGTKDVVFQPKEVLGGEFPRMLGSYLVGVTTIPSSTTPYLCGKFWEIMAAGALLVADLRGCAVVFGSLGFKEGVHYLSCDPSSVKARVGWALDPENRVKVDEMRKAAQEEICRAHLPSHRLNHLELT
jgi:hypothetical protein